MSTEHREVVVIGGGQAGLAAGHFLAGQGRDFVILEAADTPAAAWRERWDSLRLFTPARYDALPGRPFPGDPDRYPTRDEVVAYLTDYARDLPVSLGSRVRRVAADGAGYRVELDDRDVTADQVVVATGPFQTPRVPAWAAALTVPQLHSAAYRRPAQIAAGGPVLVVGGGNTGYQIAEELAATHEVHLAVGSRQQPLPQRLLGRDIFRYLDALGALTKTADSRIGRRMKGSDTLIGSSPRRARRRGIRLHPRAAAASGASVRFADGGALDAGTVIWATGFALDHAWIDVPGAFGPDGAVVQRRGVTPAHGLYFLGLPWMHSRGSALLGWVGEDAAHVASAIAARARVAVPA